MNNNEPLEFELPSIERPRQTESDFIKDLIDVSNYVRGVIATIVSIDIGDDYSKNEKGILMAYMTYSFKLYDSLVYLICDNRLEISMLIARTLSDVTIQIRYLIHHIDSEICKKIIKASLAYDKKRWNEIQKRIKNKTPNPLEKRMLSHIEKNFDDCGYKLEEIKFSKDKEWTSLKIPDMAEKVGLQDLYEFLYRTTSSAIHATWSFHKQYNLIEANGSFIPEIRFSGARPQIIEASNLMILAVALDYLELFPQEDRGTATIRAELSRLCDWFQKMSDKHEKFKNTL